MSFESVSNTSSRGEPSERSVRHLTLAHDRAHGGMPHAAALDFSVSLNPLGPPAVVKEALHNGLDGLRRYPDPDARVLRDAIAAAEHIPVNAMLPGNGSAELIPLLITARSARRVLIIAPTFGEYEWAARHAGAEVVVAELSESDGFDPARLQPQWPRLLQDVDLVFVCNPNNPSGTLASKRHVLELRDACAASGAVLVVDEAFIELTDDPSGASVAQEASRDAHLIVLRSLTKSFAVPGLRLGYLVAAPETVEAARAQQQPWPLNSLAVDLGARLVGQAAYLAQSRTALSAWRAELVARLYAIPGLRVFPSATNFLLCKITDAHSDSSTVCEWLQRRGITVRNCDSFQGLEPGRFIRVAVRHSDDNRRLIAALREALG